MLIPEIGPTWTGRHSQWGIPPQKCHLKMGLDAATVQGAGYCVTARNAWKIVKRYAKKATPSCTLCRVITLGRSGNEGISKLMATGVEPQPWQDMASMRLGKPDESVSYGLSPCMTWLLLVAVPSRAHPGHPAVGQPSCFESVETHGSWLETPLFAALKLPLPLDAI